jgi:LysR family pca operon transcriptional activator
MANPRLKLRHLHVLLAIAEQGGLVRAAKALSVTQPAVSKTLAELEDIVGQRLLDRTRKGIELTTAGRILVRYAGSSVRTLREGFDSIAQVCAADAPVIMIGALPNVAATILPEATQRFLSAVPGARLRVRTGSNPLLLGLLHQGELDVIIGRLAEPAEMQGLSFEYLYSEPLVFVVRPGHPLLAAAPLNLAMLLQYRLVLPDADTRIRDAANQFFVSAGMGLPTQVIETIDVSFGRSFVLQTDAVWCMPFGVVEPDILRGTLKRLPLDTSSSGGPVGLSLRPDHLASDALQRLLIEIRLSAAELLSRRDGSATTKHQKASKASTASQLT